MAVLPNPHRGTGVESLSGLADRVITDPTQAMALFRRCPAAADTPLLDLPLLASELGVGRLHIKDESGRMGLGSFKALGAPLVIAREAHAMVGPDADSLSLSSALEGRVYTCASAGNHGLSLAAGAKAFGARAVVFIAETVPEEFVDRLKTQGAEVVRAGSNYEASMAEAVAIASDRGWTVISDSSWPGYYEPAIRVMEGYLILGEEVLESIPEPPTHVYLQAGVGGFAAAMTALFRSRWGDAPQIVVVEPESAACLAASIEAGSPVAVEGPVSAMGLLDCKEPSHLALARLAVGADYFVTVTDSHAHQAVELLREHGVETTPSGAAGIAGLQQMSGADGTLDDASRVLAFITEGAYKSP